MLKTILLSIILFLTTGILVPLFLIVTGLALDRYISNPFNELHAGIPGMILVIFGLMIIIISALQLRFQGKGLPISPLPPSRLVTGGLYRFSRHPIYLGALIVFLGIALLFSSFWMVVLSLPLLVVFYSVYALKVEEPVLIERYGDEYHQYRSRVPLIFPAPKTQRFDSSGCLKNKGED